MSTQFCVQIIPNDPLKHANKNKTSEQLSTNFNKYENRTINKSCSCFDGGESAIHAVMRYVEVNLNDALILKVDLLTSIEDRTGPAT